MPIFIFPMLYTTNESRFVTNTHSKKYLRSSLKACIDAVMEIVPKIYRWNSVQIHSDRLILDFKFSHSSCNCKNKTNQFIYWSWDFLKWFLLFKMMIPFWNDDEPLDVLWQFTLSWSIVQIFTLKPAPDQPYFGLGSFTLKQSLCNNKLAINTHVNILELAQEKHIKHIKIFWKTY